MDGVHDMGGMHGFGPIVRDELSYHDEWEVRVHGISNAMAVDGGGRFSLESLDPAVYLGSSYYERWLLARINTLLQSGVITQDEFDASVANYATNQQADLPADDPEAYAKALSAGDARDTEPSVDATAPRFDVGDQVVVCTIHPDGHTRLPRYVRGRRGTVILRYRPQGFQDHEPIDDQDGVQPMYAVRFEGTELWGDQAEINSSVVLDMWESYLEEEVATDGE
jgi:nitrile hydratase beta subunit